MVSVHGGAEQQARPVYGSLSQYLLAHGIGILEPNIRGASGYGHVWQSRIYRDWGGIDLDDLAAAAAYLRSLTWVQPDRLAIIGRSYGGFAALSCLSRLPDLWAAGVSICGPANLQTFARSMPADWAAAVAAMIGDPDTEADKLRARSPVTYAHQITAPLLVIQDDNDPWVPTAETDQIVERARANGSQVTYLAYDGTGPDTIAAFLIKHLTVASARRRGRKDHASPWLSQSVSERGWGLG